MLKTLGRDGIDELVTRHCALARRFAARLAAEPGVRILNEVTINQVIVGFGTGDAEARRAATEGVIAKIQAGGVCFVGGAEWRGDWVMRLSITSGATTEADVDLSADAIIAAWREMQQPKAA